MKCVGMALNLNLVTRPPLSFGGDYFLCPSLLLCFGALGVTRQLLDPGTRAGKGAEPYLPRQPFFYCLPCFLEPCTYVAGFAPFSSGEVARWRTNFEIKCRSLLSISTLFYKEVAEL